MTVVRKVMAVLMMEKSDANKVFSKGNSVVLGMNRVQK